MALGFFTVRTSCRQILPQYRKTRRLVLVGGVLYLTSAGAVHALIGSLADWTSALSPLLGVSQTETLVYAQYQRLLPTLSISYIGMLLLALTCGRWRQKRRFCRAGCCWYTCCPYSWFWC